MKDGMRAVAVALWAGAMLLQAACSSPPTRTVSPSPDGASHPERQEVVEVARGLVGIPYRFGGNSRRGMDCSGLVQYVYRKVGVAVPRTVAEQRRHAFPVSLEALQPGDLLFFRLNGRRVSHVGLYLGEGRFIHAPSTGKRVTIARLNDLFWSRRLVGAGRFY